MVDRSSVNVEIGATLTGSFSSTFRRAREDVRRLTGDIAQLGTAASSATRASTGLLAITDQSSRRFRESRENVARLSDAYRILIGNVNATANAFRLASNSSQSYSRAIVVVDTSTQAAISSQRALQRSIAETTYSMERASATMRRLQSYGGGGGRGGGGIIDGEFTEVRMLGYGGGGNGYGGRPPNTGGGSSGGGGGGNWYGASWGGGRGGGHGGRGGFLGRMGHFGTFLGAEAGIRAGEYAFHKGASYEDETVKMRMAGMSASDITQAQNQAWRTSRTVRGIGVNENLKTLRELRYALGNDEHARNSLEGVQKASSIMGMMAPNMNASENSFAMIKALEEKGVTSDPRHTARLMERMTAASIASGGKVTGRDFLTFGRMTKGKDLSLSDDFYTTVAPTLIQRLGAGRAGNAVAMMERGMLGGHMEKGGKEQLRKMGLMGHDGEAVQGKLLQSNPFEWVQTVMVKRLEQMGEVQRKSDGDLTDASKNKLGEIFTKMYSSSTVAAAMTLLGTQGKIIGKDIAQANAVSSEAYKLSQNSPLEALKNLGTAIGNFTTAVTRIDMPAVAKVLNTMANLFNKLAAAAGPTPVDKAGNPIKESLPKEGLRTGFHKVMETNPITMGWKSMATIGGWLFGDSAPVEAKPDPKKLKKFARGGQFTVKGSSGTDTNLVSFMATQGEHVSVTTEAEQRAGGSAGSQSIEQFGRIIGRAIAKELAQGSSGSAGGGGSSGSAGGGGGTGGAGSGVVGGGGSTPSAKELSVLGKAGVTDTPVESGQTAFTLSGRKKLSDKVGTISPGAFAPVATEDGGGAYQKGVGGSRSWRNNNPGNIEYGKFAKRMGAIGSDGRFAIFPNYKAGRGAQEKLLFDSDSYKNLTLAGAINKWAPGSENNVPAYIAAMGANPNTRMSQFTTAQRAKLLDAMQRQEGWKPGKRVGPVASAGGGGGTSSVGAFNLSGFSTPTIAPISVATGGSSGAGVSSDYGGVVDLARSMKGANAQQAAKTLNHYMHSGLWCADFVNGALAKVGRKGTENAMARSFFKWGQHVDQNQVAKGDVLVKGSHVGLATGPAQMHNGQMMIPMISGNHGHKVGEGWAKPGEYEGRRGPASTSAAIKAQKMAMAKGGATHHHQVNAPITIAGEHKDPKQIAKEVQTHLAKSDPGREMRSQMSDWVA